MPARFFLKNADLVRIEPDSQFGIDGEDDFRDEDPDVVAYSSLLNLVTHQSRRVDVDVATKAAFSIFLTACLKIAGYFEGLKEEEAKEAETLTAMLLLRFLQAFQFNTHMIESVFGNRVISGRDAETRIWKEATK